MPEIALNVPFEASEIVQIVSEELQSRMRGLSPLQGGKEYASFTVDFQVKIKLRRAGEQASDARETLAWGGVSRGEGLPDAEAEDSSTYQSKEPNDERVDRDMPLTVETSDGRGSKVRKRVKVKA